MRDVQLKNLNVLHVGTEEDAEVCIQKLHKTMFEGRELHLERSTSKLRKEPGMSDKCFTCGAHDHKTPNCPQEQHRRKRRADEVEDLPIGPDGKRPTVLPTINLAGNSTPANWGCKVGGGSDADPELPRPTNPELGTLYEQYLDARTKYFFFRERLSKELSLQPMASQPPTHLGRFDMTSRPQQMIQPLTKQMIMQPGQMTVSAPAMQYSSTPSSYQPSAAPLPPSVYASAAPVVSNAPYATRQPGYATMAPQQTQLMTQAPALQPSSIAPTAPYNSMLRQPPALSSVNYATPQSSAPPGQYMVTPQNGAHAPPSAPYSSNAQAYRQAPTQQSYTSHYSTIPAGPR